MKTTVKEYLPLHQITEQFLKIGVVRQAVKLKSAAVLQIPFEFIWIALAKVIQRGLHFALHNLVILFFFVLCTHALPRKFPFKKVE